MFMKTTGLGGLWIAPYLGWGGFEGFWDGAFDRDLNRDGLLDLWMIGMHSPGCRSHALLPYVECGHGTHASTDTEDESWKPFVSWRS